MPGNGDKGKVVKTGLKTESGQSAGTLMIEEERNVGSIPWSCYFYYLQSIQSWPLVGFMMLAFVLEQSAAVSISWWLGVWSGQQLNLAPWQYMAVYAGKPPPLIIVQTDELVLGLTLALMMVS